MQDRRSSGYGNNGTHVEELTLGACGEASVHSGPDLGSIWSR
jgi:hypothetical protein